MFSLDKISRCQIIELFDYYTIGFPDSSVSPADIVRVMFNSVGTVGIGEYPDEVEADFFVENRGFEHILLGVFFEVFNLCPGDGVLNIDEIFITSIFHFDEDECGSIECNNIEFTVALSPVFIKNLESVFDQEFFSEFFA